MQDTTYLLYPRINKTVCKIHHDKVGPTLAANLLADAVSTLYIRKVRPPHVNDTSLQYTRPSQHSMFAHLRLGHITCAHASTSN